MLKTDCGGIESIRNDDLAGVERRPDFFLDMLRSRCRKEHELGEVAHLSSFWREDDLSDFFSDARSAGFARHDDRLAARDQMCFDRLEHSAFACAIAAIQDNKFTLTRHNDHIFIFGRETSTTLGLSSSSLKNTTSAQSLLLTAVSKLAL